MTQIDYLNLLWKTQGICPWNILPEILLTQFVRLVFHGENFPESTNQVIRRFRESGKAEAVMNFFKESVYGLIRKDEEGPQVSRRKNVDFDLVTNFALFSRKMR